jgi:hypothetical protein
MMMMKADVEYPQLSIDARVDTGVVPILIMTVQHAGVLKLRVV